MGAGVKRLRSSAPAIGAVAIVLSAPAAWARHADFLDETWVSSPFTAGEVGFELGVESRLDRDYRAQGWFAPEIEVAPMGWAFLEAKVSGVSRGQGLELGDWAVGARLHLAPQQRLGVDVTAGIEYEIETAVGKHPNTERLLAPRAALTRHVGAFTLAANLGAQHRLSPYPATGFAWGFGVRFPNEAPLAAGIEVRREPLEQSTRVTPQAWIRLPGEARLRLGGIFDVDPGRYRFVARAVFESEFF